MAQIVQFFTGILLMLLGFFVCISVVSGVFSSVRADEYKADVIAEIEDSNFNAQVMEHCKKQAEEAGYDLTVTPCEYDADGNLSLAEVILSYSYEVPLLGIEEKKQLRGVAR